MFLKAMQLQMSPSDPTGDRYEIPRDEQGWAPGPGPPSTQLSDVRPGLKNMIVTVIVLEIGDPKTVKDGHEVRTITVADKSGSMNFSAWGEPGKIIQSGDVIRLKRAYASPFKDSLTLYVGKNGTIERIGDFCLEFSDLPNLSEQGLYPNTAGQSGPGLPSGGYGGGGGRRDREGRENNNQMGSNSNAGGQRVGLGIHNWRSGSINWKS